MFSNMFRLVFAVTIDMMETRTNLRTIKAQIVQILKNNEPRPKFTGSYKKKACSYRSPYEDPLF